MSREYIVRLKDIAKINQNSYSKKDEWEYINYLDTGNITENTLHEVQYIDLDVQKLPSRAKRKVKSNSIIYSTVRPNQLHYGIIKEVPQNFLVSTGFAVIDIDPRKAVADYIYYYLTQKSIIEHLHAVAEQSVSTYPSIKMSDIENIEIKLPDTNTQIKVASVLSKIDQKIKINDKINNNLEQQAMAIFKSWFIDYEPFPDNISIKWKVGTIKDLSKEIICGKTPSTKKAEYYGSDVPFITIPDMHNKIFSIKTTRSLSIEGAASQIKKMLPKNAICVSCIGTAGLVTITSEKSQTNQQINAIIPKDNISPYFIFLLMKTLSNKINKLGQGGSTIVNLNKEQFSKIEINIPDDISMNYFHKIISPLFNDIFNNQKENLLLSALKNNILPKLLSGELDVSNIDI